MGLGFRVLGLMWDRCYQGPRIKSPLSRQLHLDRELPPQEHERGCPGAFDSSLLLEQSPTGPGLVFYHILLSGDRCSRGILGAGGAPEKRTLCPSPCSRQGRTGLGVFPLLRGSWPCVSSTDQQEGPCTQCCVHSLKAEVSHLRVDPTLP